MTEGHDANGAWRRHHEMMDDVVRWFRSETPGFIRVTHDGERVLFVYRIILNKRLREFVASVSPESYCTATPRTVIHEMWRTLLREVDKARA